MTITQSEVEHVLALERELQTPRVRRDEARLRALLAPTFVEVGASGRRWDLASVLDMLAQEPHDPDGDAIGVTEMDARPLSDDIVQVFWVSEHDGRRARRTSLWRRDGDDWQQVYHQGTPCPEGPHRSQRQVRSEPYGAVRSSNP